MSFTNPIIAAGLARLTALFSERAVTPVEVCAAYLSRIERLDSALGAYVGVDKDRAIAASHESALRWAKGEALSPIDGAPIAVKANIAIEGLPWTAGIGAYRDRQAHEDACVVRKLRDAGAIILGSVNMEEGAFGATTDNPWFGRTHNPWRADVSAGGSSGGSAAAVAAGLCAAALGSDTLGSVRIPSAFCGVFGLKPTQGLISLDGVIPMSWTLDHVGVHGRSAEDCALLLAAACGAEAELAAEIAKPADLDDLIDAPLAVLRLGDLPLDAMGRAALDAAVARARLLGIEVEEVSLNGYDFQEAYRLGVLISGAESLAEHADRLAESVEGFSEGYRARMALGGEVKAYQLAGAYRGLAGLAEAAREALGAYQGLILPTTPAQAFTFAAGQPVDIALYTTLANVVGLPAMSVPVGMAGAGEAALPSAVQVVAWDDETALGLGKALSEPVDAPPAFRG